ncbi:MAG: BspA family leucine-rich repeat surface protein [Candidatus Woesearchaeota archaeon]
MIFKKDSIKKSNKLIIIIIFSIIIICCSKNSVAEPCTETWRPCIYDENLTLIECTYTNMSEMYKNLYDFSAIGDISEWNTTCITDMNSMFENSNFNQPIGNWDTSNVISMRKMFSEATEFNQPIGNWNTSNVIDMSNMFKGATSFNQEIGNWDTHNIIDTSNMFNGAALFNQELGNWDTSSIRNMNWMFQSAYAFNQDISSWDTSELTTIQGMFNYAYAFNQDISSWNTDKIISMKGVFSNATSFNQPIGNWNTGGVTDMDSMLNGAVSFNQDISNWDTGSAYLMTNMLTGTNLSIENYDALLIGWSNNDQQDNIQFDSENTKYTNASVEARNVLIKIYHWKINDKGFLGSNPFSSTWNTTDTNLITLPLEESGEYDFYVEWGDNVTDLIQTWNQEEVTHTYAINGYYDINIYGTINGFTFSGNTDSEKIFTITSWGNLNLGNSGYYFMGCKNLNILATDELNLSGTTNFANMFYGASLFNGDISSLDTSEVTDMQGMFYGTESFNQSIGNWDTSNVINMDSMFSGSLFNQNINSWNTSKITSMASVFSNSEFNQPLENWDTSKVTNMMGLFDGSLFNQPIGNWNTSSVTNMINMFANSEFNQNISDWDISQVTSTSSMFSGATQFNQPLGKWNTSRITDMNNMFSGINLSVENYDNLLIGWSNKTQQTGITLDAGNSQYTTEGRIGKNILRNTYGWIIDDGGILTPNTCTETWRPCIFDESMNLIECNTTDMTNMFQDVTDWSIIGNISSWNTSCINSMTRMFYASNFNQDISSWDTRAVTNMESMFAASSFNQSINLWNTANVTNTSNMFASNTIFNQPIGNWNTSNVRDMSNMFNGATQFNQEIGQWDTSQVTTMQGMFKDSKFNKNISLWDTSNVNDMYVMFQSAINFNQSIENWNTSSVTNMLGMFQYATSFDQPLGKWNTSRVSNMNYMFSGINLSIENYDNLLIGWSNKTQQTGITLDAGNSQYTTVGKAGKDILINLFGWNIIDGNIHTFQESISSPVHRSSSKKIKDNSSIGEITPCVEEWECNAWTACMPSKTRTRTCYDINICDTQDNIPRTIESCEYTNSNNKSNTLEKDKITPQIALFDIVAEVIEEPTEKNGNLIVKISLINFGTSDGTMANLNYTITDQTNNIVKQHNKSILVNTQTEFLDTINTQGLKEGKYVLNINLNYLGQIDPANTKKTFYIGTQEKQLLSKDSLEIVLLVCALIIITIIYILNIKLLLRSKRPVLSKKVFYTY